jgi:transcriptional regulator with XRE-family HTH domain
MTATVPKIGKRLKDIRTRQMLSQRDLAEKAGLSPTTIAKLETNRVEPNFRTLRKLTSTLNVSYDDLIEGE